MAEVALDRPPQSAAYPLGVWQGAMELGVMDRATKGLAQRREGTASGQDPNLFQCFMCHGWGHMARECPTPTMALNKPGGTEGMWLTTCRQESPQPTVGPMHSHINPRQRSASMKATQ